ncbi:glycoside hydrolase family 3 protein [Luedemannella helvata]|uniref:beta-N-acetylhexosaminidase n=1 Tax=Luedemannella helvata TaxID=349315 RepID=A0ABN2L281_9ACTN
MRIGACSRAARRVAAAVAVAGLACAGAACSPSPRAPGPAVTGSGATGGPPSAPATSAADPMRALAAGLTDEQLVGAVLMPTINLGDPAAVSAALVRDHHVGGVILMGSPPAGADQVETVRALTKALHGAADTPGDLPLLVGIDQEYGFVTRVTSGITQLPSAMAFGAAARPDLTEAAWRAVAAELLALGVNLDFAPTADVLGSAANKVIGSRSYGSDPKAVAAQVAAVTRGLQGAGVAASVKHFPGHGRTATDSHTDLPLLKQSRAALGAGDLPPFQAGIDAGAWLVMSGHLEVAAIDRGRPASFSSKVLNGLLRKQLGFTGAVVTDALNMAPAQRWAPGEAAVRALLAGNDLLLMPPDLGAAQRGLLDALRGGRLPRERLLDAATRVLTVRSKVAPAGGSGLDAVGSSPNRAAAARVAAASITVLKGSCEPPLVRGPVRVTAADGREDKAALLAAALKRAGVAASVGRRSDKPGRSTIVHLVGYGDGPADLHPAAAVTVAMDTPFILARASSPVRMATYSSTPVALEALADVLAGKAAAPGRSPVAVAGLARSSCAAQ